MILRAAAQQWSPLTESEDAPEPMGGGAGPGGAPADNAQAPTDLVLETSESNGSASDLDDSSVVGIVEPVDHAEIPVPLACVPCTLHLLGLVQQGCEPAQLPDACAPALAHPCRSGHHLATLMVGFFDQARLAAL